jgi:hypothetical protein
MMTRLSLIALVPLALFTPPALAQDAQPPAQPPAAQQTAPAAATPEATAPPATTGPDRVAALKQSLASSAAALRKYEWMETTVVSMKGEEKSRKQNRCYYGADGKVQKVPVEAPAAPAKEKRGVRGKVVANKKEDIGDSMKEAIALVKSYVPPEAARIQAAKDAGKVAMNPPDTQGKVRMVIKDYLKAGDSLTIDLNAAANTLSGLTVASYTDKEKNAVGLQVSFGALADGAIYPASIALDVKEQNMNVAITNSGYKKTAP